MAAPRGASPPVRAGARPAAFAERVIAWQRAQGRHDLPWQDTRDAYRIWVSEIMLQQTQVATVLPYYLRFMDAFPTVAALAAAPVERVLEHWAGLGYYRRAHFMHRAARRVMEAHDGVFPTSRAALETLPGIGRSTAAAIAAFSSGAREAILDGNVKRVLARHRGIEGFPGLPKVEARLWTEAEALLPSGGIESYTQGLMDLGATLCTRSTPDCACCPVRVDCVACIEHRTAELPAARPSREVPRRAVRVILLERDGAMLFERRPPAGIWSGLLSLPELSMDEDLGESLRARFGAEIAHRESLAPIEHGFTHFRLTMQPERVQVGAWTPLASAPEHVWLDRDAALRAALPAPVRKLVEGLRGPLL